MNRIVLIGNGFDLAHDIKTSYNDFIDYFWVKSIENLDNVYKSKISSYKLPFENQELLINDFPGVYQMRPWLEGNSLEDLINSLSKIGRKLIIKNRFLEIITEKKRNASWVDIELEYYRLLKDSYKNENCTYDINQLNQDFERIKVLLSEYLVEKETTFKGSFQNRNLQKEIGQKIYTPFELRDFTEKAINNRADKELQRIYELLKSSNGYEKIDPKIREILKRNQREIEMRKLLLSEEAVNFFDLYPNEVLFLNFNYTSTESLYKNFREFLIYECKKDMLLSNIHIHGTTNTQEHNDIVFGFGDEIDDDYKTIENLNNNEYLENIKSIKYLENDNYKRLLEFLNGDQYQIFILGHSCGISDRTLLSTLFEHENCVSIKPFYYLKEDGSDNYSDMARNITRNFNNKSVLRDKVVNKKYCQPLVNKV